MTTEKPSEKKKSAPKYFVAKGKEVTAIRGQLKAGEQVYDIDFPGGFRTMEAHVKAGGLEKK